MTPAWGWFLIVVGNAAWITPFDLWLHFTHRHTLTRQMHDWMFSSTIGPFIFAGIAFLVVLGLTHFLRYHVKGP